MKIAIKEASKIEKEIAINEEKQKKMPEAVKKKTLYTLFFALFVASLMMENVASFLPPYVKTKTDWVSDDDYRLTVDDEALIICVFAVAQIIFAPFNSQIKTCLG